MLLPYAERRPAFVSLGGMAANPCWLEPRMVRCRVVDVECDQFGDPQPGEQQHADDGPVPDPAGGRGCRGHRRRSSRRCSRGGYRAHLEAAPLAAHTRRTYAGRVAGYLAWLAELDPLTRRRQGDPFTDGHARDYTVRDYRTHLLSAGRAKPASVNLALAAVDHFYRFVGLGPANSRREQLPQAAPRALDVDQTRRLLRAAERTAASAAIASAAATAATSVADTCPGPPCWALFSAVGLAASG